MTLEHFKLKNGTWVRNHHVYVDGCEHCNRIKYWESLGYSLKSEKKLPGEEDGNHLSWVFSNSK